MSFYTERAAWERDYWVALLRRCRVIMRAAKEAGVNRATVYKAIRKFNLRPPRFPSGYGNAAWKSLEGSCQSKPK